MRTEVTRAPSTRTEERGSKLIGRAPFEIHFMVLHWLESISTRNNETAPLLTVSQAGQCDRLAEL